MKSAALIGIVLIVLGVLAFGYQGVMWVRGEEQIARIGPVEVTRERDIPIPLAPVVGVVAVLAGAVLLLRGSREHA